VTDEQEPKDAQATIEAAATEAAAEIAREMRDEGGFTIAMGFGAAPEGPKQPQPARCGKCNHVWIVAYLPMDVSGFARIAKGARCPMCGDAKVYLLDTSVYDEKGVLRDGDPVTSDRS
jgi:hypothetical protein